MARSRDGESGGHPAPPLRAYTACPYAELERCPRMDKCPCSQGWREGTVVGTECGVMQAPGFPETKPSSSSADKPKPAPQPPPYKDPLEFLALFPPERRGLVPAAYFP